VNVKWLLAGVAAGALQGPLLAQTAPPAGALAIQQAKPPLPEPVPEPAADPAAEEAKAEAADAADAEDEVFDDEEEGEEILVTGQRPRGSVAGTIEPELVLDRRAIRTYGAGSITE